VRRAVTEAPPPERGLQTGGVGQELLDIEDACFQLRGPCHQIKAPFPDPLICTAAGRNQVTCGTNPRTRKRRFAPTLRVARGRSSSISKRRVSNCEVRDPLEARNGTFIKPNFIKLFSTARSVIAAERRGNNLKDFTDFYLKAKARIWP